MGISSLIAWTVIGLLLIILDIFLLSAVAAFIGASALITAILLYMGIIESTAMQFFVFGVVTCVTLLLARKKLKVIFKGKTLVEGQGSAGSFSQEVIGQRIVVASDFINGSGRVSLNGVQWNATASSSLKKGEAAWIESIQGIELHVTKTPPTQ